MAKNKTKAEQFADYADAVGAIRKGQPPRRHGAKDRSIPTHPVVDISVTKPEKFVVAECLTWLRKNRIMCDHLSVGSGVLGESGYRTYGIIGAGDIIGLLRNGLHFEIECKAGKGGRLSKGQQKREHNIRDNNGIYLVVHGVEELAHFMRTYI